MQIRDNHEEFFNEVLCILLPGLESSAEIGRITSDENGSFEIRPFKIDCMFCINALVQFSRPG